MYRYNKQYSLFQCRDNLNDFFKLNFDQINEASNQLTRLLLIFDLTFYNNFFVRKEKNPERRLGGLVTLFMCVGDPAAGSELTSH